MMKKKEINQKGKAKKLKEPRLPLMKKKKVLQLEKKILSLEKSIVI